MCLIGIRGLDMCLVKKLDVVEVTDFLMDYIIILRYID